MKRKILLSYEIILFNLAVISVVFIWSTNEKALIVSKVVWFIFFIDVVIRFFMAKKKWQFIKENPFDIIAALPLDSIFQTARIVRLFKVFRFYSIGKRYGGPLKKLLQTNHLGKILTVSVVVIIMATIMVTLFEPEIHTFGDGLWWSIVTTTTVGYGDLSPHTGMGRLIAMVLMLIGIGIIGTLTSSITTYFVKGHKASNPTIDFIIAELERYQELSFDEKNRLELLIKDLNQSHHQEK